MEEVLAFFGFSLGASLGVGVIRSVSGASQPIVRELLKAGIRARDSIASASASAAESADEAGSAIATPRNRGARKRSQPEKIIIAHQ